MLNIDLCANEKTVNATLIISISYNLCHFVVVFIIEIISKTWLSVVQRSLLKTTNIPEFVRVFPICTRGGDILSAIS